MPRGRRRGEPGVGEEEEDEGGNFKFLFFSVNVNTVNIINLIFFVNKYYELYIEVLVWLLSPSSSG